MKEVYILTYLSSRAVGCSLSVWSINCDSVNSYAFSHSIRTQFARGVTPRIRTRMRMPIKGEK